MKRLAEMDTRELGGRLAVMQALSKLVKEELDVLKGEMRDRLLCEVGKGTADSIPLMVGDQKVGRYYATKPMPTIIDDEAFGKWACEQGLGSHQLIVNLDPALTTPDALESLIRQLQGHGAIVTETHKANVAAKRALSVVGSRVVDANGEIVPGAYPGAPQTRITPIKPADVAQAMRLSGDSMSVAGLLGGE